VALCLCLFVGAPAWSTPENDPLLHLLQERGVIDAKGQPGPAAAAALAAVQASPAPVAVAETPALAGDEGARPSLMQRVRDKASDLVLASMNFLGVPYRYGGNSPDTGFDCSGFTRHVFENTLGLVLPRRAEDQARNAGLQDVNRSELKPGDLVFFNTLRRTFSHVGIYVGDDKFIHAPRRGSVVRVDDMRVAYWTKRFDGARRAPQMQAAATASTERTR
jgi:cell wall-associated NlpC family hydrolase